MLFETLAFTADRGDAGIRLDLVLLRRARAGLALSRRRLQRFIAGGQVRVNGVAVNKTAARIAAGDRIEAVLPAPRRPAPAQPEAIPLQVLFEDEHLLAIDKRPGLVVHPSYKHAAGTLFNALLAHVGDSCRPRLLNRLDKDTSGVVLVSKTRSAHAAAVRAVRAGEVEKHYLAIVHGRPRPATGTIVLKLRRDPSDVRRVTTSKTEGKESVTRYETLSTSTPTREGAISLVRCELATGRMHQIRVHLAARGWPIVGDRVYGCRRGPELKLGAYGNGRSTLPGPELKLGAYGDTFGAYGYQITRHALHAWRLSLPHPVTGEPLVIVAPVPDDMLALIREAALTMP